MSGWFGTKKRKVGGDGTGVSVDNTGCSELTAVKSMMQELVNQNRTQTNIIQSMREEISRLTEKCDTMETTIKSESDKMNSRFDGVDDKLKYHDILLQNQQWDYDPMEDWSTLNENEKHFLKQVKKCTEKMRYGKGNGDICLSKTPLRYKEAFLPHWKEFANALEQYCYHLKHSTELRGKVSQLRLLGIELPDEVIDLLSKALKSTHFDLVALRGNNFGQKGISFVLDYLKSNPNLKEICLHGNPINNMDDIDKLCKIIKQHPSINYLDFGRCIGADIDGYEVLTRICKSNLKVIKLTSSNIRTGESTFISDFLASNPMLENLDLWGNDLNDSDALNIANALKQNTKLSFLDLRNNNLTSTGWMALRMAEFDDTSLNAAYDSNHTCNMVDIAPKMNGGRGLNCDKIYDAKRVRQKKIYVILSHRNRECLNAEHFDEFPVEILPDMLHSIQEYSNYHVPKTEEDKEYTPRKNHYHVNPLSLVYELCRHWEESFNVFEALSS